MKTVLITGGSSGIGFEISKHFGLNAYQLVWVSLYQKELSEAKSKLEQEIKGVKIHTLEKDLSKDNAAREVFDWVHLNKFSIDVLVNNAGFGTYGYTNDISIEKELGMINLNVLTTYKMTRLFLEEMMRSDKGTIINMCSNTSFQPVARMNTYASTKAFILHFSRGLQEELELQKSNVRVLAVCPAAIGDTNFKFVAGNENAKTFNGIAPSTSKVVAKDVWDAFEKGRTFVVTGRTMRLLHTISPIIPYKLQQFLVRKETELKKN